MGDVTLEYDAETKNGTIYCNGGCLTLKNIEFYQLKQIDDFIRETCENVRQDAQYEVFNLLDTQLSYWREKFI